MLKTFGLHCIFVRDAMRSIWATPFFLVSPLSDFCILAQEGPRDFSNIAKCSQWPHLYMGYEATYCSKCKFIEICSKNDFLAYAALFLPNFRILAHEGPG